ncbi:DUF2509 family protein [Pantoea sp. BAV 3049]|uniref:DUF2509 family protein n=1 Tax=Pantoea sp. BAV 3049 TaxID=2654188 RepID=UPI001E5C0349|nr:DUF2509 family protein [Pantoea sp. BAV 3049]
MWYTKEQGSGAMIMVIMLLLMSAALLNTTRRQLDESLSLVADERQYFQQASQALSALAWGEQQSWSPLLGWQCKTLASQAWRACLLEQEKLPVLLRGDSGAGTIAFYQWLERSSAGSLEKSAHGWLDFCPLSVEAECEPDE